MGAEVRYHDPHVPAIEMEGTYRSEPLTEELLRQQGCLVVTTDQSSIDYRFVARHAPLIFDTRNAMKHVQGRTENIHLL